MKKKTILLIGNFLSTKGGTTSVFEDLAKGLQTTNNWDILTTPSYNNRFTHLTGIISTIIFQRNKYSLANIEVYSTLAFLWAEISSYLLSWLRKPFILSLHGGGLPQLAKKSPQRVARILNSADAATTPSKYIKAELKNLRDDIIYLPNGINLSSYKFKLRTNPNPKLCWLRAFHKIYNPQLAIEAMAKLYKTFPDITLVMIGPDKNDGTFGKCVDLAIKKGVLDHIRFVGSVKKTAVPDWLNKGDIFLNTTNYESFGVSVAEAAACGLPIVTTNVGELGYLWKTEIDALLVPPGDAEKMSIAVNRILTEQGLAEKISTNARKIAENFDWSVVLPEWESLFTSVIKN